MNHRPKYKSEVFLVENLGVILRDSGFGNAVLDLKPKVQLAKKKIDKLNFIKIENVLQMI